MQAPAPTAAPRADVSSVAEVFTEFVNSDYARQLCNYCNVQPTDYGIVSGMFETIRVDENKLVVKLKFAFEQRSEKLLDRLQKHLRANRSRLPPNIKVLQYVQGSMTRTIVI